MSFDKLTDYKQNIIMRIISSENLVKAIGNNYRDFLDQPLPDPYGLIYSNIYPYRHVPTINTEPKTFLTMSFTNFDYRNNEFKSGVLSFYIITHQSLMSTDYGLRSDYILGEIDKLFNRQSGVGAFKLNLLSGGDLQVNDQYFGAMVSYKFHDFQ